MRALSLLFTASLCCCLDFSGGKFFRCETGGRCGGPVDAGGGGAGGGGGASGGGGTGGGGGGASPDAGQQRGLFKASQPSTGDAAGHRLALAGDGRTLAFSSIREGSDEGAVWVFSSDGTQWTFAEKLKASNAGAQDAFGDSLAISDDGLIVAVGAPGEDGSGRGANSPVRDEGRPDSGAVYVFERTGTTWVETSYLKGFDSDPGDLFGTAIALTGTGNTLAVGSPGEDGAPGAGSTDNSFPGAGAVWVVRRVDRSSQWAFYDYVQPGVLDRDDAFGSSVALSADGSLLAAGAPGEDSASPGAPGDNSAVAAGAAEVFVRTGTSWAWEAIIKPAVPQQKEELGTSVSLSADGNTLAVGAPRHSGPAQNAGAVYVFERSSNVWDTGVPIVGAVAGTGFGQRVALDAVGVRVITGMPEQNSGGSAVLAVKSGAAWNGQLISPAVTRPADLFGTDLAFSLDGRWLAIGAPGDASGGAGATADPDAGGPLNSGAVWLLRRP